MRVHPSREVGIRDRLGSANPLVRREELFVDRGAFGVPPLRVGMLLPPVAIDLLRPAPDLGHGGGREDREGEDGDEEGSRHRMTPWRELLESQRQGSRSWWGGGLGKPAN